MLQKINILTAFFVLLAGIVIIAGCSSPQGGDTKDEQVIEQPTNGGKTEEQEQQPGNSESGNENESGNTGNNGNENENTGNSNENQNSENGNGNESGNTGNENVNYGGEPYDKAIGNGNYTLHNFVGENTYFPVETIVASTTHYLDKAETYVKGLANNLNSTLEKEGRTDAQNYFNDLITAVNNDDFYIDANYPGRNTFDLAINDIDSAAKPYIADIIKNLPTENDRYAFYITYRILANESKKEGLGTYRQYPSDQMTAYQNEKADLLIDVECNQEDEGPFVDVDIEKDYGTNNFKQTTKLLDDMLDLAVTNMNKQKNNNNYLRANDLRQVINLSIATNSLASMHDLTQYSLGHEHCTLSLGMELAMQAAINAPYTTTTTTQQNQDQSMGL